MDHHQNFAVPAQGLRTMNQFDNIALSPAQMQNMTPQQMNMLMHKAQQQQHQQQQQQLHQLASQGASIPGLDIQDNLLMMPPPPPRPSTAMGAAMPMGFGMPSRPGTSLSHRSPVIPGPDMNMGFMPQQQQQQQQLAARMQQQQQQQFNNMGMDAQQMQRMQQQQQQQQQQQMMMQQQMQMARPQSRMMNGGPAATPRPGTPTAQQTARQLSSHSQTQSPVSASLMALPSGSVPSTPAQLQHLNMAGLGGQGTGNATGFGGGTSQHGSPPATPGVGIPPGSPYRGAKRKLGSESAESPRLGGGQVPTAMMNGAGMTPQQQQQQQALLLQQQQQQQQMMMQRQRMSTASPRPGSSMGMGMGMVDPTMGGAGAGGLTPHQQQQLQLQQQMQQQMLQQQQQQQQQAAVAQRARQGSMPPPPPSASGGVSRQGSLPPPTTTAPMTPLMKMGGGVVSGGTPVLQGVPGVVPPSSLPLAQAPGVPPQLQQLPQQLPPQLQTQTQQQGVPQGPLPAVIPALPPLPANVSLNPAVTKVTPVPTVDSLRLIPELTPEEIAQIKEWKEGDAKYENGVLRRQRERWTEEVREAFGVRGPGPSIGGAGAVPPNWNLTHQRMTFWWEKDFPGANLNKWRIWAGKLPHLFPRRGRAGELEPFDIVYPRRMRPVGEPGAGAYLGVVSSGGRGGSRRPGGGVRREGLKVPGKLKPEFADRPELLVPIRLDIDVEHQKMKDTFVWNMNDPLITPDAFAQSLVEDYGLPPKYHTNIVENIQTQLAEFQNHQWALDTEGGVGSVIDLTGKDDGDKQKERDKGDADAEDTDAEHDAAGQEAAAGGGKGKEEEGAVVKKDKRKKDVQEEGGAMKDGAVVMRGKLEEEDQVWWDAWRERVRAMEVLAGGAGSKARRALVKKRLAAGASKRKTRVKREQEDGEEGDDEDEEGDEDEGMEEEEEDGERGDEWLLPPLPGSAKESRPLALHEIPLNEATMHEEMRILIKLDIIVGSMKLDDQFEWDMEGSEVTPEEFAEVYTKDLGLNGEFKTAIAHSIREQVVAYQKSLFLVGHPSDGTAVQDEELRQSFLPSLISGARPPADVSLFTPTLNYLSDGELERLEKEREKDMNKRRKRNTRGRRGVPLPDREPVRTYRTPAIGFPELDATALALAAAANAPVSRRAAAAAASLTIANMVASENGTAFMPQSVMPSTSGSGGVPGGPSGSGAGGAGGQQQQQQAKEKKAKGLFKAPSLPSSVLSKRASVVAPTPGTALGDLSSLPAPLENDPPRVLPAPQMVFDPSGRAGGPHSALHKMLSAKRAKELEREAKEREFVDGQHANLIDGVWHCSNCGCPESIAVGRRKGPLGDKSQCGPCGKFWHRHRRPRPVEYNPDPEHHSGAARREAEGARAGAVGKKKGRVGALAKELREAAAHAASSSSLSPHEDGPATPKGRNGASARASPAGGTPGPRGKRVVQPVEDDEDEMSAVSGASSGSEAPLAAQHHPAPKSSSKTNGSATMHKRDLKKEEEGDGRKDKGKEKEKEREGGEKGSSLGSSKGKPVSSAAAAGTATPTGNGSASASAAGGAAGAQTGKKVWPPLWLTTAIQALQKKYPHDKFDIIFKKQTASSAAGWRLKCSDCPGKLYTPGPDETLNNYEVHLKNRNHRSNVEARLNGTAGETPSAGGSAKPASGAASSSPAAGAKSGVKQSPG